MRFLHLIGYVGDSGIRFLVFTVLQLTKCGLKMEELKGSSKQWDESNGKKKKNHAQK